MIDPWEKEALLPAGSDALATHCGWPCTSKAGCVWAAEDRSRSVPHCAAQTQRMARAERVKVGCLRSWTERYLQWNLFINRRFVPAIWDTDLLITLCI